jgi:GYF domain 2
MKYFVKRGDEKFGPYSLADIQQYVQSGNIALGDLAQSEGMSEWFPVSQVIGNIPIPVTSYGAAAAPAIAQAPELVALPPNLHWAVLLILEIFTRQLFNLIWALVQANWARKLIKNNKPLVLVAMYPAGIIAGIVAGLVGGGDSDALAIPAVVCVIGGVIAYIMGIFSIRSAMEEYYNSTENIGLSLSGVMTFFFSAIYLQYHINRIARWKKTGDLN